MTATERPRESIEQPRPDRREGPTFRAALEARRLRLQVGGRVFAFTLLALVATGVALRLPPEWWVPAVGFVALAGLVFRLLNWTCPACGGRLPTRGGSVCLGCGARIDESHERGGRG
jgi:hypothetical protein